jgi:hypothetical protein
MPNKVTAKMPSKTEFILKYGSNWYLPYEKARKEFNNKLGIVLIDWIESKISTYKNYRFGKTSSGKIVMINIYSPTWIKPQVINFQNLPADLKYHKDFENLKP